MSELTLQQTLDNRARILKEQVFTDSMAEQEQQKKALSEKESLEEHTNLVKSFITNKEAATTGNIARYAELLLALGKHSGPGKDYYSHQTAGRALDALLGHKLPAYDDETVKGFTDQATQMLTPQLKFLEGRTKTYEGTPKGVEFKEKRDNLAGVIEKIKLLIANPILT